MKNFTLSSFLFMLTLMGATNSIAQNLGIDTAATNLVSLPDTINLNDNYNHTITIENKSAVPLTGTIWLMAAVDTGSGIIDIDSVGFANVTNFGLNDTVSINYNETYNFTNSYKLGGNIVVVWPIASLATTNDSLFKNVFILNPASIENTTMQNEISIYPNPTKNYLKLELKGNNKPLKIKIIDMSGRVIFTEKFKPLIDISKLPKGIYTVCLTFKNEEFSYKLIKE